MSDPVDENGEEAVDETGRNPTQRRLDEEGTPPVPVDAEWEGEQ
ncbi:MAG: hypothetical protein ACJ77E_05545 [Gaiellaceae bacterium]|jgi:hypothetical protein